jgi:UDP-N-acetylmuramate: L-alanyl-gamma-D-glutamyl-meso-diaminopimelate ligase
LWAIFEPRSNTAGRKIFEEDYARAFRGADALIIAPVFHARRLTPEMVLDRAALARRLADAGKPAFAPDSTSEIPEILRQHVRAGDVLILMSSGAFGGLPATLLDAL